MNYAGRLLAAERFDEFEYLANSGYWRVPSRSVAGRLYLVRLGEERGGPTCTCAEHVLSGSGVSCAHIVAAGLLAEVLERLDLDLASVKAALQPLRPRLLTGSEAGRMRERAAARGARIRLGRVLELAAEVAEPVGAGAHETWAGASFAVERAFDLAVRVREYPHSPSWLVREAYDRHVEAVRLAKLLQGS